MNVREMIRYYINHHIPTCSHTHGSLLELRNKIIVAISRNQAIHYMHIKQYKVIEQNLMQVFGSASSMPVHHVQGLTC